MHTHMLSIVCFALSLTAVLGLPNQALPAGALRARAQPLEATRSHPAHHPSKPHEPHYPYPSKRHEPHYPYPSKRHEPHYPYPSKRHEAHYPYPSKRHEPHYPKPSKRPEDPHHHHEHGDHGDNEGDHPHAKRAETLQQSLKDVTDAEIDFSSYLCPMPASACPIDQMLAAPASLEEWHNLDFECIDIQNEVKSCGACVSLGQGNDCTATPGVHHVTCTKGRCVALSCTIGYTLDASTHTCVSSQ